MISLPTVIWSGAVAALISLCGVILSNIASIKRLKDQLKHDATEKHRDRLATLRKDVYLTLTAEINRANGYLGSLAAKDPTEDNFGEPLHAVIAELAKVQLVASSESAEAAAELAVLYGETLLRLTGVAKPMHEAKIDIKISDDLYQQSFLQGKRVLAEITTENESGSPDQARLSALFKSLENYQKEYSSHANNRDAAWEQYVSGHIDFAKAILEETKQLGPAQIKLTCAIRAEVGLDTNDSELERRLADNHERMSEGINALVRSLTPPNDD